METLQRTANRGSVSTGFDVANSTAFDKTRTEYYTRDVSSTGNRDVGTISMWYKRGTLNVAQYLFTFGNTDNFFVLLCDSFTFAINNFLFRFTFYK